MSCPEPSLSPLPGRVAATPAAAGLRRAPCALAVAAAFALQPAGLNAQTAVHGKADVVRSGDNVTITTANGPGTRHSVINWQSFGVPEKSVTEFIQPSGSTSINRVTGNDPSRILGRLVSRDSRLVLVNPAGITVGAGASIDTAGFTASTLFLAESDAIAGLLRFGGASGGLLKVESGAMIRAQGGDIVLVAPRVAVADKALVQADGSTILAAGQKVEITGRGLEGIHMEVRAGNEAVNLGTLQGDAVGIFANTLRHSGLVRAQTATLEGGRVLLKAQDEARVAGTVDASSVAGSGRRGGEVAVLGASVRLDGGASVDVSGDSGGGAIRLGGDFRGGNAQLFPHAQSSVVADGVQLDAGARRGGDGGRIIVWSDGLTRVHGRLSARGGSSFGNGGLVETSGHSLDLRGIVVDAGARAGRGGTWLLDPINITVTSDDGGIFNAGEGGEYHFQGSRNSSTIAASTIVAALNTGSNVVLDTSGDGSEPGNIVVNAAIAKTDGGDARLTLDAHGDIDIRQSITSSSGRLDMAFNAGHIWLGTIALDGNGGGIDAGRGTVGIFNSTATIRSSLDAGALVMGNGVLAGSGNVSVGDFSVVSSSRVQGTGILRTRRDSTIAIGELRVVAQAPAAATPAPTAAPPTSPPTSAPTAAPTSAPTSAPAAAPTAAPTAATTPAPTAAPVRAPSRSPAPAPSFAPAARQVDSLVVTFLRRFVTESLVQENATGGTPAVAGTRKKRHPGQDDIVVTDTQRKP